MDEGAQEEDATFLRELVAAFGDDFEAIDDVLGDRDALQQQEEDLQEFTEEDATEEDILEQQALDELQSSMSTEAELLQ